MDARERGEGAERPCAISGRNALEKTTDDFGEGVGAGRTLVADAVSGRGDGLSRRVTLWGSRPTLRCRCGLVPAGTLFANTCVACTVGGLALPWCSTCVNSFDPAELP